VLLSETVLDLTGHKCPIPVLKTKKALKSYPAREAIKILVTDPSAPRDFRAFCETAGHEFIAEGHEGDIIVIRMKKGEA
jgi:tRNA 2-thiouridine synthesizing protein A